MEFTNMFRLDISSFTRRDPGAKWIVEVYERGLITFEECLKMLAEREKERGIEEVAR